MELEIQDIQNLQIIDREISADRYSPAEYEILRRAIYATADFDYQSSLCFSPTSLLAGSTALAARATIVVDIPIVRVGILPQLQKNLCQSRLLQHGNADKTATRKNSSSFGYRNSS